MTTAARTLRQRLLAAVCGFVLGAAGAALAQDIPVAVTSGDVRLVRSLLARDPTLIKAKDKYGNNLLRLATLRGDTAMVEALVAAGADVNETRADDGSTTLHVAAGTGSLAIARIVVSHGAGLNPKDARGNTPLAVAVAGRKKDVAEFLLARGAEIDLASANPEALLRNTLAAGLADLSRRVMRERALDYTSRDGLNQTFLHFAARGGQVDLMRALVQRGVPVGAADVFGWTPLHVAAANGQTAVVDMLVAEGADRNARTSGGYSASNLAERDGRHETLARLRALKADPGGRVFPDLRAAYVDSVLPADGFRLFAPDIVSDRSAFEHSPVAFSPDLRMAAWSAGNRTEISTIFVMEKRDGRWTAPVALRTGASHPAFSRDGRRLFFTAMRTTGDGAKAGDEDIFYAERTGDGWSAAVDLGPNVNTERDDSSPSLSNDDTLYFESEGEIFRSTLSNGRYGPKQKVDLGGPAIMPWIAADGSFLIVKGIGAAAPARLAFRQPDGTWSRAVDIPDTVRTRGTVFPSVTPDGRYLFVATGDVLWTELPASLMSQLRAGAKW